MRNRFQIICATILLVILSSSIAYCRFENCSIEGTVLEKETLKPIHNANVYLAYTLTGSATNKFGHYCIGKIDPGQYFLVVSHVAHEDLHVKINVKEGEKIQYNFYLLPKIYQMKPIVVLGDSLDWKKSLKRFLKDFLGTSENSKMATIINTNVLDFDRKGSKLYASANAPLDCILALSF